MKQDDDVVIVSALRTPLCRSRKGALAKVLPSTLVETVVRAILTRTGVSGQDVEDICLGNCLLPPSGYAALRMAHIVAGVPYTSGFQTINRQCSSGLQAVAHIVNAIQSGQITVGIGGGVESMSLTPMYVCVCVFCFVVLVLGVRNVDTVFVICFVLATACDCVGYQRYDDVLQLLWLGLVSRHPMSIGM